jgi:hypothetical protein
VLAEEYETRHHEPEPKPGKGEDAGGVG